MTRGEAYNEWASKQTDSPVPLSWLPNWEPYDGPNAELVQRSRNETVANCILFSVERAIGSMYLAETDESEEARLLQAKQLVRSLRT